MFFSFNESRSAVDAKSPLNVVFFETQEASPHLETTLELAQNHLDCGDHVTICFWTALLPYREPWEDNQSPESIGAAFRKGCEKLDGPVRILTTLGLATSQEEFLGQAAHDLPVHTIEQLKNTRWRDFDLGMGIVSSLASRFKVPSFDIIEHEQLCRDAVLTCMLSYEATLEITRSAKCDLAYVFNGRFCGPRGILRALQAEAVEHRIHERGCDMFHYSLMTDVPHSRTYIQKHIRSLWKAYRDSAESRRSRARQFFNKRREGASTGWLSYTSHQDHSVPEELLRSHRLVSYFASSDDEFLAIGDAFEQWGFKTQAEAVLALIVATEAQTHCHLVIRVHPGLRDKSADARKFWENLKTHERCTVLTADSPVRTYDLIDASDLVVTYGSTVGVEANHQGKPSLLLGSAFYDELGVAHTVFSTAELAEFLSDPEKWKVHDETGALMYGFYSAAHGIPFEYYTPSTLFSGRFKDDELFAARGPLSKFSFGGLAGKFRKKCGTIIGQLRSVVATRR